MFPGGAPMNVAYHLRKLSARPVPVTAVGSDELGTKLLQRFREWGVNTSGVSVSANKPTGISRVTLVDGNAEYEIVTDVAWDWIELKPEVLEFAPQSAALVFGSLAQRSENNRRQLDVLLSQCAWAMKVFDVNLRAPHDSPEVVWKLAEKSDLLKLNDNELKRLLGPDSEEQLEANVRKFTKRTGVSKICVTAGHEGAGLFLDGKWFWEAAEPVTIQDTIGAGDSFLAALLCGLMEAKLPPREILRRACRLAEFVVSQDGATPDYQWTEDGRAMSA